eukprot:scaffold197640_cov15-Tisochrysis_lutea.AAC.1
MASLHPSGLHSANFSPSGPDYNLLDHAWLAPLCTAHSTVPHSSCSSGASLVAPRAVVTAAHCLDQSFLQRLPNVDVGRFKM